MLYRITYAIKLCCMYGITGMPHFQNLLWLDSRWCDFFFSVSSSLLNLKGGLVLAKTISL